MRERRVHLEEYVGAAFGCRADAKTAVLVDPPDFYDLLSASYPRNMCEGCLDALWDELTDPRHDP
jgi:hypothetical protein